MSAVTNTFGAIVGGTVGFFLGGPVGAAIGAGIGMTGVGSKIINSVLNFATQGLLGLMGIKIPDAPSTTQTITGVLVQTQGSDVNVPVIYGYRKVGGTVVFCETGSDSNKYLWVAYVFSEGHLEGLKEIWIDDYQLPASIIPDLNNGGEVVVTGKVVNATTGANEDCKYNNLTHLMFWSGTHYLNDPTATNVGNVVANTIFKGAPSWTRDMYFNGLCTVFARYEFPTTQGVSNPFTGSIPAVQISVLGRHVASLVDDDNNNAYSHPENYNFSDIGYTARFSYNPAEILLDYLRNPYYGKGLRNDDIDWDTFKIAAKKCNTQVEYYNGVFGPIHTMSYVVNTGNTVFSNVKDILSHFRANLTYVNGKYKLLIEDAGNPTDILSGSAPVGDIFTKDNIQGTITYTGIEKSSKYTSYKVNYVDPSNNWSSQSVTYPDDPVVRQQYITTDNGRENPGEITLSGISNPGIAYDLARLYFNKSREQDSISFTASSEAFFLEPGDIIYINANILKFGTDPAAGAVPWRIVSIKLNNDFTFLIGCVRNPNTIYPHTRTNELNYNIGIWIPKGATRTYPQEPVGVPVSYWPPGYAYRGAQLPPIGFPLPPKTDVTVSGGAGGPGSGPNSPGNGNSAPTVPIAPPALNDLSIVFKTTYVSVSGLLYADLSITQPNSTLYGSTKIFYKRNIASEVNYVQVTNTDRPGAGQTITQRIGPLLTGYTYLVKTYVNYLTGETAQIANDAVITPSTTATSELPVNYTESTGTGWAPPTAPPTNNADAMVKTIIAQTVLSAGQPTTPRTLLFTVLQDIDTYGQNNFVTGLHIFYKQSAATYWKETQWNFPSNYIAGVSQPTFGLADLGIPSYPSSPSSSQLYDFIFRYTYNDGKSSKYEYKVVFAPVEQSGSSYNYNAFTPNQAYGTASFIQASSNIITEANAPKGAVTNPLDTTIGITGITTNLTDGNNTARFTLTPPNVLNQGSWYGVRVYYRPYLIGSNLPLTKVDVTPVTNTAGVYTFVVPNITYGNTYEFVIVPLVESSGKKEATNCVYIKGAVNFSVTQQNLLGTFTNVPLLTTTALNNVTTFPSDPDPVPAVLSWKRIFTGPIGTTDYKNWYYQLQVQVPVLNFQIMYIYRRENNPVVGSAYYAGVGRWERFNVAPTGSGVTNGGVGPDTYTFDSNGIVTINFRGPTGADEFDTGYPATPGRTLVSSLYPDVGGPKPIAQSNNHEIILVLQINNHISQYGLSLPQIPLSSGSLTVIDGLAVNKPTKVTLQTYEDNYPSIYYGGSYLNMKRKMSDYRYPVIAATNLVNGRITESPYPTTTPGVI